MLNNYRNYVVLGLTIVLVGVAANVQADFIYNFNGLPSGQLVGNDGWTLGALGTATDVQVDNAAVTNWSGSGNYAKGGTNQTTLSRVTDLSWLQNNVSFDISTLAYAVGNTVNAIAMLGVQADDGTQAADIILVGTYTGDDLKWYVGSTFGGPGWITLNSGLGSGVGGTFKVGIEATANGDNTYSMQPYYVDVTNSGSRVDVGIAFNTTIISDLSTKWTKLQMRAKTPGMLDDFTITQIPEPSSIALLAAGLIGLLAYAWRKRK
ncbi:MAG: PEP-CTERM sorting domain-containing protein [Pirellulales bacterium]|nr:PEP-CTERM sorting domain-containing protein [Pirellulales bacterium]